ncbi:Mce protein [Mycolicibacterium hodleri]|uniref:Mce protein n=1 Tax=Mycolicibacterium hodleri TaxID=49897 RepID=A0A502EFD8_9MYCO|nr:Mce protein [Mycolicibacterium hodleri]TPG35944.1 Mce protein [Mycolicibacterium hodleri]
MADDDAAPSESREPESTAVEVRSAVDTVDSPEADAIDDASGEDDDLSVPDGTADDSRAAISNLRWALIAGLVAVLALGGLTGWLGYRANQSRNLEQQRNTFLQVGQQGAINLTTLDYEHIDADVQRILDSATGTFYDDFQQRAPSFIDVVKQVKSKSVGTVTAAALEKGDTSTQAEVLVAITVKSMIVGQPEQQPRAWRMRILVQEIDDQAKVSNVEFVP